jgi:DNA repair protein RadD
VVQDEGHHILRDNKWGKAMALFPNARGLFPTAHAVRADGAGLGRAADGLADRLVTTVNCRDLIERGFLTDYRLLCPATDIDFSNVAIGSTGDYSQPQLRAATHSSNRIVGDVVKHYLGYAAGKLGVTFAVDIEAAKQLAAGYRAAGIPAEIITGKTPISVRGQLMRRFRARQILQLVSVDCLGEGVDVPAIEVISMVRKTASFQLYAQQFGRSLRPMIDEALFAHWGEYSDSERIAYIAASMKPKAIVIDHVGNCMYHGLPDVPQEYSLLRRESGRRKQFVSMLRTCDECLQPYERFLITCPHCQAPYIVADRGSPESVEGDLIELDPAVLAQLRGAIAKIDRPCYMPVDAGREARKHILAAHHARHDAQQTLRAALALWGGWWEQVKNTHRREAQKRFYLTFGIDVMTAQTLDAAEAQALESRVREQLARLNVVAAA